MGVAQSFSAFMGTYADNPDKVAAFWRLRKILFVDKLGWDLRTSGQLEVDEFDRPDTEYCVVSSKEGIMAGFRAIRTDHDYLASRIFPQLATQKPYPHDRNKWEISRFGVLCDANTHDVALLNYSLMFRFARRRHAVGLVALADLHYERYLRTIGIRTRRYGPSQKIGVDAYGRDLVCVAGEIPIAEQPYEKISKLIDLSADVEISDAAFQRSAAISA
jgi:acyl homoserine lactone synthase